ncbi:SOS-response transcriptional repressor LexA [Pseudacidovorax sp. 1753]|uniref:hypothetical protein n=1 Tax=Pseudacidovorax sp. 1753 TaxID=3156419 RepID=UPI0033972CE9
MDAEHSSAAAPRKLTARQAAGRQFLADYLAENDNLPTLSVIAEHFGWASSNAANTLIGELVRAQVLEPLRKQKGYRFTREGDAHG